MQNTMFRCGGCGYRANVLAASDRGEEVARQSMVCRACKAVVVVVVARRVPGETRSGPPTEQWQAVAGQCPTCRGGTLLPWPPTHPCPRCGAEMDDR